MPRTGRPAVPPDVRFWKYVQQGTDECWEWTGSKNCGYGHFWHGTGRVYAHRWVYEYLRADIPAGLQIDHLCRNRACVNPWHMEPVTPQINTLRSEGVTAARARQDECIHGHPFTVIQGRRTCRTCRLETYRRYRQKRKSA